MVQPPDGAAEPLYLELGSVRDGDIFELAISGEGTLWFSTLGARYLLAFAVDSGAPFLRIAERIDGSWIPLGAMALPSGASGRRVDFRLKFGRGGRSIGVSLPASEARFEADLSQEASRLTHIEGTNSSSASHSSCWSGLRKPNLKLPNPDLTLVPMFHYSRSGSTVLSQLLPRDEIAVFPEIYSPGTFLGPRLTGSVWERFRNDRRYTPDRIEALLAKVLSASRPALQRTPKVFCEIKLNLFVRRPTLSVGRYFEYLNRVGVENIVFLQRRNLLRRLVSVALALRTGEWHRFASPDQGRNASASRDRVRIDVGAVQDPDFAAEPMPLVKMLELTEARIAEFDALLRRHFCVLDLWFEDHVENDPNLAAAKVADLFNVPHAARRPNIVRQNSGALCDLVENVDDVFMSIRGTPYEWMFSQ